MSKKNFLSEAPLKDEPKKAFHLKLKEGSVTTGKLADEAVLPGAHHRAAARHVPHTDLCRTDGQ